MCSGLLVPISNLLRPRCIHLVAVFTLLITLLHSVYRIGLHRSTNADVVCLPMCCATDKPMLCACHVGQYHHSERKADTGVTHISCLPLSYDCTFVVCCLVLECQSVSHSLVHLRRLRLWLQEQNVLGAIGQSCTDACADIGKSCSSRSLEHLDTVRRMGKLQRAATEALGYR